ncbi:LysM peptidoglycan-binding domain-containing protein [Oxalobacteraceae bacterium OTU3REALA1]|nr:LysM peptidoglycan-binding domain-containing protein [Oxalobacteraceae bacterium OTU3REALA1]
MEYLSAKYDADTMTCDYAAGDGSHLLRSGGTAAWRFNNPGNLRPGRKGKVLYGAIGVGKTKTNNSFLIFSSYEEGRKQKKALLRRKYNARTIYTMLAGVDDGHGNMIEGYAPASDSNNPTTYAEAISKHTGLPTNTVLSTMTDAQLESMMDAMEQKEGYHAKKDTRKETIVHTTSITLSDGAKPKPGVEAKIQAGPQEHLTQTDKNGRLPTIVHTDPGQPIQVFMKSLEGDWKKVYDGVMAAKSSTLALFNPLNVFSAPTAQKKATSPQSKPVRVPIRYAIEPHDTLAKIAKRFTTTVPEILRDNPHIKNASRIYPAQVITIYGNAANLPPKSPAPKSRPLKQVPKSDTKAAPPNLMDKPAAIVPSPAPVTRSKEGKGAPLALLMPDQKQAPWMLVAVEQARKWAGKTEDLITKTSNFHKLNGSGFLTTLVGTDNAWCGSFVNYCLSNSSPSYTKWKNPFRARAIALDAHFVEIKTPVFGAILLVGTHHVSLVYAKDGANYVCLGGNQSDQINFSAFGKGVRFFVPLAYHAFALQEIAKGKKLAEHTADELNLAFGIPVKKKKGNALR